MNDLQIDHLRDIAIDNLPRARTIRDKAHLVGGRGDYYRALAYVAIMDRTKATTRAEEFAAANVLEIVCWLRFDDWDEPISSSKRKELLTDLVSRAKELCMLTGYTIPWLEDLPSAPQEPEKKEEEQSSPPQQPVRPIAGRSLSTKEAAEALGYAEQTLREWRSDQTGPVGEGRLKPFRLNGNGRLRWSGDEILALLKRK